ncbi:hypothetical protein C8F01DRAFT_1169466 [Mycena amicta]|nr:hypothetical protein C8F01DRAFT_1169466 [Mycena amicta]
MAMESESEPEPCAILERPPLTDADAIFRSALNALHPELDDVPLPFIQQQTMHCYQQMLRGLRSVQVVSKNSRAATGTIRLLPTPPPESPDAPNIHPTHLLAVSSPVSPADHPSLVAIHSVVFVAQCTRPVLDSQAAAAEGTSADTLAISITPVTLPCLRAFHALLPYIYAPTATTFLHALFRGIFAPPGPLITDLSAATRIRLASHRLIAAKNQVFTIRGYAVLVREVWECAMALGMYRRQIWDLLDFAWASVAGALGMALDKEDHQLEENIPVRA